MRNNFLIISLLLLLMVQHNTTGAERAENDEQFYLFIGAYTDSDEEGISIFQFDASDGELTYLTSAKGIKNPSYLAINEKKNLLIAVNEISNFNGENSGSVSSFRINPLTGSLTLLSQVPSGGGSPCYVSINKSATLAFVANYSGGNVSVFPMKDGKLSNFSNLKQHSGSGATDRQKAPHAHSIVLEPNENFALAVDLGIDQVITYSIDEKKGLLSAENQYVLDPGSGPRHMEFHPNKRLAFVINELNSTITSCSYDAKKGSLSTVSRVSTLPSDFEGENYCADIHVSPGGKFLYGSNRGHDSMVIFQIDPESGTLTYVGHQSVKGNWPRNFMIDPTGKFLLVANQNSNNVVVFKIDAETGQLRSNGVEVQVNKPVCLKMMKIN